MGMVKPECVRSSSCNQFILSISAAICAFGLAGANARIPENEPTPPFETPKEAPYYKTENDRLKPVDGVIYSGQWLERVFSEQFFNCTNSTRPKLKKFGPDVATTLVPRTIIYDFSLLDDTSSHPQAMKRLENVSIESLFTNVYEKVEKVDAKTKNKYYIYTPDPNLRLTYKTIGEGSDKNPALAPGVNALKYNSNCTSTLTAALSVTGGYKFTPIAAVQGAFNTDFNSAGRRNVSLLKGTFASPLVGMFSGQLYTRKMPYSIKGASKLYSGLLLWKFYRDNPSAANKKLALLEHFFGIAMYDEIGDSQTFALRQNGSINLSIPFLKTKATESGLFKKKEATESEKFEVVMFPSKEADSRFPELDSAWKTKYYDLPSIADLTDTINRSTKAYLTSGRIKMYGTAPLSLTYSVVGITEDYCTNSNAWTVSAKTDTRGSSLELVSVAMRLKAVPEGDAQSPVCEFLVRFTPSDEALVNVIKDLVFEFALKETLTLDNKTYQVKLPSDGITIAQVKEPIFEQDDGLFATEPTPELKDEFFEWQLSYRANVKKDPQRYLLDGQLSKSLKKDTTRFTLKCQSRETRARVSNIAIDDNFRDPTVTFTLRLQKPKTDVVWDRLKNCAVSGTVDLTILDGKGDEVAVTRVLRQIPIAFKKPEPEEEDSAAEAEQGSEDTNSEATDDGAEQETDPAPAAQYKECWDGSSLPVTNECPPQLVEAETLTIDGEALSREEFEDMNEVFVLGE